VKHPTDAQWTRICEDIRAAVDRIETAGPKLFARDQHTAQPDGFPSSSLGGDGRGGGNGSSTEMAALAETRRDAVHSDAVDLHRNVLGALKLLHAAEGCADHAAKLAIDKPADHGPSGVCAACQRHVAGTAEDRIKKGWCSDCLDEWTPYAQRCLLDGVTPDRGAFVRTRRGAAAA
jgi:hypothetical protein